MRRASRLTLRAPCLNPLALSPKPHVSSLKLQDSRFAKLFHLKGIFSGQIAYYFTTDGNSETQAYCEE